MLPTLRIETIKPSIVNRWMAKRGDAHLNAARSRTSKKIGTDPHRENICSRTHSGQWRLVTVLPHGVILPEIGNEDFAFRRLVEPVLSQRFMLAYSLHRPTTLAMRELARRVRIELTKAVADGRMVGRIDQPQVWSQTDSAGE